MVVNQESLGPDAGFQNATQKEVCGVRGGTGDREIQGSLSQPCANDLRYEGVFHLAVAEAEDLVASGLARCACGELVLGSGEG
jgi:hypothetical protein